MLLLASVVFGRSQAAKAFEFLPEEEAALLKHRFEAFQSIPKEQRLLFSRHEMRCMLNARRRRLATAEPEHLAGLLSKEKPVVAEVVLRVLPAFLAQAVQAALPGFRETPLRREPRAEVLSVVRWKLEEKLQNLPQRTRFQFGQLAGLQTRELMTLCDRMGARVFATSLAGLPEPERQRFLEALPPDQKMLAQKACEAATERRLQTHEARRFLELYQATQNPSTALRSAGAQRVIRACLAESPEFASKIAQKHKDELGKLLSRWLEEEKDKPARGDRGRADILEQLEFLAKRGFVERPLILNPKVVSPPKAPAPPKAVSSMGVSAARLPAPPSKLPGKPPAPKPPVPSKVSTPQAKENVATRPERSPPSRTDGVKRLAPPSLKATNEKPLPQPLLHTANARSSAPPAPKVSGVEQTNPSAASKMPVAARSSAPPAPKAFGVEQTSPSAASRVPVAARSSAPPAPKASGMEQTNPSASKMPSAVRKAVLSASRTEETTDKALVHIPAKAPANGVKAAGKGSVIRVPALQSIPLKRATKEAGATKPDTKPGAKLDNEKTDHCHKSAQVKPGAKREETKHDRG